MRVPRCAALLLYTTSLLYAQVATPPEPLDLPDRYQLKPVGERVPIHAEDEPEPPGLTPIQRAMHLGNRVYGGMVQVSLEIVINENGRVDSAHAIDGPERFRAQAEEIEMHRAFEPVVLNGSVTRVRAQDEVSVFPVERWQQHHVPFPDHPDLATTTLSLERTGCLGSCPSYTVAVNGRGEITFHGEGFTAIPGTHRASIKPEDLLTLLDAFRHADFLYALDEYQCNWTDLPSERLTLTLAGKTKRVYMYGGSVVGLPDAVAALTEAVDHALDTDRWINGDDQSLPSLRAEHWDFASGSADNLAFYDAAIERKRPELVQAFLAAKAPVVSSTKEIQAPVCVASAQGDRSLVERMLATLPEHARIPAPTQTHCLLLAAQSGDVPTLDLWLARGASPRQAQPKDDDTRYEPSLLFAAIQSHKAEMVERVLALRPDLGAKANNGHAVIVRAVEYRNGNDDITPRIVSLLIAAGADVNEVGEEDNEQAIFQTALAAKTVQLLVAAGANPNARNSEGETPLIRNTFDADCVAALLAAGADPRLKSKDGKTALDKARESHQEDSAKLLEEAIAKLNQAGVPQKSTLGP